MNKPVIFTTQEATKKVLDHGFVHLVDMMPHWNQPLSDTGLMPADARVVQAARVSMAHLPGSILDAIGVQEVEEEDRTYEKDEKLIKYLMKNKHETPFEKVNFEFVVKLPIFIARQWIRHRIGSFNEMSARYSKLPREYYLPSEERMQKQSASNKQASGEPLPVAEARDCQIDIVGVSDSAYESYELMLDRGLARELARMVLPTNFYTTWYWTVNFRSLANFLQLRLHSHAQWEVRQYAQAILEMVEKVAPISTAAFREYVLNG